MKNLTLENLTKVCGGVYFGPSDKLEQEFPLLQQTAGKQKPEPYLFPS